MSGYLDVDNVTADGPEHYYATCDASILQTGTYNIGINNFSDATGRIATVQVATASEGEIFSTSLDVGGEKSSQGDSSPIPVVSVIVAKDLQGKFKAAIQ